MSSERPALDFGSVSLATRSEFQFAVTVANSAAILESNYKS